MGNDLLVAPITKPQIHNGINNQGKRDVYLPSTGTQNPKVGRDWYLYKNNTQPLSKKYEGGSTIRDFDSNINTFGSHINFIVPLFVREGAIIPTVEIEQWVGQKNEKG